VTRRHCRALVGARRVLVASAAVCAFVGPKVAVAQSPDPVASVFPDTIDLADVFELRIELAVPPGSVVYFPDTIPATAEVESRSPVEWRARGGPDGGATLELTYPLMAFGMGPVDLPALDIVTMPLEGEPKGERIPGGSVAGDWVDAPPAYVYAPNVTGQSVWVRPLYTSEDIVAGLSPRPPGDVQGLSWSLPAIALLLVFSAVIGGAAVTTTREWLSGRVPPGPEPVAPLSLAEVRARALSELDRMIGDGPYPSERAKGVYDASSGTVRGYAERLDPAWGPELTSTELMTRLGGRALAGGALVAEMGRAEAVKFGRLRPDATSTEAHLRTLREWVRSSPEVRP